MKRIGTSACEDIAVLVGTVAGLEIIKWAFGLPVAFVVATAALIGCVAFLWYAGRESA